MSRVRAFIYAALFAGLVFGLELATPRSAPAQVPQTGRGITLTSFQFTVAVIGTPTQLSTAANAPTFARQVTIQPLQANVSNRVEIRSASGQSGYELQAGQQIVIPTMGDLTGIYIKVFTANDGVSAITWVDNK